MARLIVALLVIALILQGLTFLLVVEKEPASPQAARDETPPARLAEKLDALDRLARALANDVRGLTRKVGDLELKLNRLHSLSNRMASDLRSVAAAAASPELQGGPEVPAAEAEPPLEEEAPPANTGNRSFEFSRLPGEGGAESGEPGGETRPPGGA